LPKGYSMLGRSPWKNVYPMKGLSNIKAAILAGGIGTQLRPAMPERPKAFAEGG